jgi:hypothetical protein
MIFIFAAAKGKGRDVLEVSRSSEKELEGR